MTRRYLPPGHHRSIEEFRDHLRGLDPAFDCDVELQGAAGPLGKPREVFGRVAGNRFAIHPMEGWDGTADGMPSEHTTRRWQRFGASGAALVWGGEAFAVRPDGRANPRQLCQGAGGDASAGLAALLAALRQGRRDADGNSSGDEPIVGLQLTHSGRWSRPDGPPAPRPASRHPVLDDRLGITDDTTLLTDGELEAIGAGYVEAAIRARDVGFHFVDVKACHGYLLHELLGARSRRGSYGGSFEGRTRLFRTIVDGIRSACPELGIGVRVSLGDVRPFAPGAEDRTGRPDARAGGDLGGQGFGLATDDQGAFALDEPMQFVALCRELGVGAINVTLGSPYYCPHLQRPATYPPSDGYLPPEDPLHSVLRHLGVVRACKAHHPDLPLVGTGYSYLQEWLPHVAQHEVGAGHVDFVGLGRMVLSYPELPRDVLAGRALTRKQICRTFSDCTTAPRNGMVSGCYPLDDHYARLPESLRMRELRRELR